MAKFKRSVSRVRADEKIVSIHDAYENFLQSRYASCSEATIRIYNEKRKPIEEGFAKYGITNMDEITPGVIRQILIDYKNSHSDNGAWKLYTYIRTFLRWYWNENDLEHCPIEKVDPPKKHEKPKHGITHQEIDKLLKAIKQHSKFPERDVMIVMILTDTGLRKKSVLELKMKDVDLVRNTVYVLEKDQNYHTKSFGRAIGIHTSPNSKQQRISGDILKTSVKSVIGTLESYGTSEDILIRGKKGSEPDRYAKQNGCVFEEVKELVKCERRTIYLRRLCQ